MAKKKSDLDVFKPPKKEVVIGERTFYQTTMNFGEIMDLIGFIIETIKIFETFPEEEKKVFTDADVSTNIGQFTAISIFWKYVPDRILIILGMLLHVNGEEDIVYIRDNIRGLKQILVIVNNALEVNEFDEIKELFFEMGEKLGAKGLTPQKVTKTQ